MIDESGQSPSLDDDLFFSEEQPEQTDTSTDLPPWKIIIADDQEEIHSVTKLVLDDFTFMDRGLHFLSAYSGAETKQLITEHPDVAFILLDVVMETDDAGLEVVRFIREELRNSIVQIVLNTGQPGQAPEHEVITKYDINDYKSKTEFNARKLLTSITASLRAFSLSRNLHEVNEKLNDYRNHLEDLVKERTAELEEANHNLTLEIEERKKAEQALQESNDIQNDILAASPIGICLVQNGLIEWGNDEMCGMFLFSCEADYKGKSPSLFYVSQNEFERVEKNINSSVSNEEPVDIDAAFKRMDGTTFSGNLKMGYHDAANPFNQYIITISDISWRLQAEKDRNQKERLQGALEMSGSVCHELNQPLQYISGSAEILLMDMKENSPFYNTIVKMKTQIDRMGNITKKLMGITSYKTRDYVGGRKIIDIEKASAEKKPEKKSSTCT